MNSRLANIVKTYDEEEKQLAECMLKHSEHKFCRGP